MLRTKFKRNLYFFTIITLSAILSIPMSAGEPPAFRWPIIRGSYPDLKGITSTFGESRRDHFHNGLDISVDNEPVTAVAPGELLYVREASHDPFHPVPGPGNYVFINHGKGWWSGYYHLKRLHPVDSGKVGADSVIGYAGNTGHSSGAHLHFFMIRDAGRTYLNPLDLLPPITDNNPPIIGQIALLTPNGKTLVSHSRKEAIRLTKRYPIYIHITDPGFEKHTNRGVYRLRWRLNGGQEESMVYNSLNLNGKGWVIPGNRSFEDSFYDNLYNLGELDFTGDANELVVTAEDFNGNSSTVRFTIQVDRRY
jgi:hypothetical protein